MRTFWEIIWGLAGGLLMAMSIVVVLGTLACAVSAGACVAWWKRHKRNR